MPKDRILIVEDDYLSNLELRDFMCESGFCVEGVYDGITALAAIRRNPPGSVVTDLDLGPGPNGFEVARQARAARPDVTVVYISGHDAARHLIEGVSGSEFIAKPYRGSEVVDALRRAANLEAA